MCFFACSDYMPHYHETVVQRFRSDLFKTFLRFHLETYLSWNCDVRMLGIHNLALGWKRVVSDQNWLTVDNKTLSIQVCPKKGINPTVLLWGWDWDHQTYSTEGYGSLGVDNKTTVQVLARSLVMDPFWWTIWWILDDSSVMSWNQIWLDRVIGERGEWGNCKRYLAVSFQRKTAQLDKMFHAWWRRWLMGVFHGDDFMTVDTWRWFIHV